MSTIEELIREDMRRAVKHMNDVLNRQLFYSAPVQPETPRMPPTVFATAGVKAREFIGRAKIYVWTIWRALRGDALDTATEREYW